MLFTVQCIDDGLLDSPNAVSPENVDPDFLLNNIQMQVRGLYASAAGTGATMTRMRHLHGDTFGNAFTPGSFNAVYNNAYSSILIDIQNLLDVTEVDSDSEGLHFHRGKAKVLKAYTLILLVDVFGDVPFSEALLGAERFNPELDSGESVYEHALALLDEAIGDLENDNRIGLPSNDLYYGHVSAGNREAAWVRTANTIKLKAYLNTDNVNAINDLIDDNNLILENSQNFTFDYSTNDTNPDSRHPLFSGNYVDLAASYMALNYMNMLLNDKALPDPRTRYYFYRQTNEDTDDTGENTCVGTNAPSHFTDDDPWCYPEGAGANQGWWGRNYLIDDGIPPDRGLRTTFGVYPAGGQFDANQAVSVDEDMGLAGAGFEPILMSSFTHFMLAEAQHRLGAQGDALTSLQTAVRRSLTAVRNFGASVAEAEVQAQIDAAIDELDDPTEAEIEAIEEEWNALLISEDEDEDINVYVGFVTTRWNNNTSDAERLRNIAKEYYLALWPNGYEAYNLMRRTQYPDRDDNLQPARAASPGDWYRSFLYPATLVERNSNVSQKTDRLVGPFWDPHSGSDKFNF